MDFKQVNDFEEIKMESDEDIIWITVEIGRAHV